MSESHILVRLLRIQFPRNWEFGSALSKLRNFGGFEPPPLGTPLPESQRASSCVIKLCHSADSDGTKQTSHSLTHTHPPTRSLTAPQRTLPLIHSFNLLTTRALNHSLVLTSRSLIQPLIFPHTYSFAHPHTISLTHSLIHMLVHSPTHSRANQLAHSPVSTLK